MSRRQRERGNDKYNAPFVEEHIYIVGLVLCDVGGVLGVVRVLRHLLLTAKGCILHVAWVEGRHGGVVKAVPLVALCASVLDERVVVTRVG